MFPVPTWMGFLSDRFLLVGNGTIINGWGFLVGFIHQTCFDVLLILGGERAEGEEGEKGYAEDWVVAGEGQVADEIGGQRAGELQGATTMAEDCDEEREQEGLWVQGERRNMTVRHGVN